MRPLPILYLIICCILAGQYSFAAGSSDQLLPPVISVGPGVLFYQGDIGNNRKSESFFSHAGLQFELQLITKSRISVSAFYMSGKVSANNYDYTRPLNFQSSIFSQGLQARYDFISKKNPDAVITPFIGAGFELLFFRSYTDLLDANGNKYYYWSDGSIRNDAEPSLNATTLYRDYVYETNIRDADLDGFGKYRENCLAFPFTAGARMRLTDRASIHFFATYHLLRSDLIDGISFSSVGNRKGDKQNDRLVFSGITFRYDLASKRNRKSGKENGADVDKLAGEDADGDGIPDIKDAVIEDAGKKVDASGRPVDTDGDGIPDFRDKEPRSARGAIVNQEGVTMTARMMEEQGDTTTAPAVLEHIKAEEELSGIGTTKGVIQNAKPIPTAYRFADTNNDGFISPTEIGKATEDFMAGKSELKSADFYKLIDFYFEQYK